MAEPQTTVLSNGMTVVTQHLPSRQTHLRLNVGVGARHETPAEAGISHFLEHMLAADTERLTVEESAAALQRMRGTSNAQTGYESTDFEFHLNNAHTEDAIQMLADGMLRSTITPDRLEAERGSIQQEWLSDSGDVDDRLNQNVLQLAFPGSGLDKSIDGTPELIALRSRDDLAEFMQRHYSGDKMVLTVVGDVDHETVCKMVDTHFAGLPTHSPAAETRPAEYRGGMRLHYNNTAEETSVVLGFPGSGHNAPQDKAVDNVIAGMLAGSFASRLIVKLRNETGLVYDVEARNDSYQDNGVFKIATSCDGEDVDEVMEYLCDELREFAGSITADEVEQAKSELVGELERGMMDASLIADILGDSAMNGKATSLESLIEGIEAVDVDSVRDRAAQVFSAPPCVTATGNRRHKLPSYNDITHMLGKERSVDASGLAVVENLPSPDRAVSGAQLAAAPARGQGVTR